MSEHIENKKYTTLIIIGLIFVAAMFAYSTGYDEGKDRALRNNEVCSK